MREKRSSAASLFSESARLVYPAAKNSATGKCSRPRAAVRGMKRAGRIVAIALGRPQVGDGSRHAGGLCQGRFGSPRTPAGRSCRDLLRHTANGRRRPSGPSPNVALFGIFIAKVVFAAATRAVVGRVKMAVARQSISRRERSADFTITGCNTKNNFPVYRKFIGCDGRS